MLPAKLPFTTTLRFVLSTIMDTLYAVGRTEKNINFGGRQNGLQNQDRALTSCVTTLGKLLKVSVSISVRQR